MPLLVRDRMMSERESEQEREKHRGRERERERARERERESSTATERRYRERKRERKKGREIVRDNCAIERALVIAAVVTRRRSRNVLLTQHQFLHHKKMCISFKSSPIKSAKH